MLAEQKPESSEKKRNLTHHNPLYADTLKVDLIKSVRIKNRERWSGDLSDHYVERNAAAFMYLNCELDISTLQNAGIKNVQIDCDIFLTRIRRAFACGQRCLVNNVSSLFFNKIRNYFSCNIHRKQVCSGNLYSATQTPHIITPLCGSEV